MSEQPQVTVIDKFELKGDGRNIIETEQNLGSFEAVLLVSNLTGEQAKHNIENYGPLLAERNALAEVVRRYENAARMADEAAAEAQASRAVGSALLNGEGG